MKLETYNPKISEKELLKATKIKMEEIDLKLKQKQIQKKLRKKRRIKSRPRTRLGGGGLGVSAQRGVNNFLGMLKR